MFASTKFSVPQFYIKIWNKNLLILILQAFANTCGVHVEHATLFGTGTSFIAE
jgi:hypothetical protein